MKNGAWDVIFASIIAHLPIPASKTWQMHSKANKFIQEFTWRAMISKEDGVVRIDRSKCVGCLTCVLVCPYGALAPSEEGTMQKCELCLKNSCGEPACVTGCPNKAIVYEERD